MAQDPESQTLGCRSHQLWCGRFPLAQVAESASCVCEMRPPRKSAARDGPCAAWHISRATRAPSIAERRSEPAFFRWLAGVKVRQVTSRRACCCGVFVCLLTVESGCSLGMRRVGGVCICCCVLRSWYILVLYIGVLHHGNCRGRTHRLVLLSHSPSSCNVCHHACHTCPLLWSRWCSLAQSM